MKSHRKQAKSVSKKTRSLRHVSCGGVVFKGNRPSFRVCLISRKREGKLIWGLPKGHVETGETKKQTALREIQEETGITGQVISPLQSISYTFVERPNPTLIFKQVHFFLVRYLKGNLKDHDDEVISARWFSISEALRRAEYSDERAVLKKAVQKLKRLF